MALGGSTPSLLLATAFALAAYTVSVSFQTYWQLAPISLYGQLLFLLAAVSVAALLMLAGLALYLRDATILLPHSDPAQRRIFCFTCCHCCRGSRSRSPGQQLLAPPPLPLPPPALTWACLSQTEVLLLLGANNAVASLLQWYSNPPTREPPLIGALVPTLQAFFAVPLSAYCLGDQRRFLRGGGWLPYLSALCLFGGVAASLAAPASAAPTPAAERPSDVLLWTLLNVLSQVPSAMALVGAQAYLLRAGAMEPGAPPLRRTVALARFVVYNQAGVGLVVGACWWLDVLPWFGSSSLGTWWSGLRFSLACSLGWAGSGSSSQCPPATPLYAALAVLPYPLYLAGIAYVSGVSAVYGNALEVGQGAVQTAVWLLPGLNPAPAGTPLWAALLGLGLTLAGVGLLRVWEAQQQEPGFAGAGLQPVGEEAQWYRGAGREGGGGQGEEQAEAGKEGLLPLLHLQES